MVVLPFTKRTTASVTVFACLFAAKDGFQLASYSPTLLDELHQEHDSLRRTYHQLVHQDAVNQACLLDSAINNAATYIAQLDVTVNEIVSNDSNQYEVEELQLLVGNALTQILIVQQSI